MLKLKYIYDLVLCKQTFNVKYLDTTREGFLKSVVQKMEKGDYFVYKSVFSVSSSVTSQIYMNIKLQITS